MSSKLTSLAWNYQATKQEDKLLLLALAEISDNKGNCNTSLDELSEMTGLQVGIVRTVLHQFTQSSNNLLFKLSQNHTKQSGVICGVLQLENGVAKPLPVIKQLDLAAQAKAQHERLNAKAPTRAKLNKNQKSQILPLDKSTHSKTFHKIEIHLEKIPDWAEGLLHKNAVDRDEGRSEVWAALVSDVHATDDEIFTLAQLINRLNQKIFQYKDKKFNMTGSNFADKPTRKSELSIFKEKVQNYLAESDESE